MIFRELPLNWIFQGIGSPLAIWVLYDAVIAGEYIYLKYVVFSISNSHYLELFWNLFTMSHENSG